MTELIIKDTDQIVINRLCEILARDLFFHHRMVEYGATQQSDDLQAALSTYLKHYVKKPRKRGAHEIL